MPREKILYHETYRDVPESRFDPQFVPVLKHTTNGVQPDEMRLLATGVVERGEESLEFHDIRFYFKKG